MDIKSKNKVADLVQEATAETLQKLTCPACDGSISIQFVPKGRRGKGAGALSSMCTRCMWRVVSDVIRMEPPWVRELGPKIQTAQKLVSPQSDK